MPRERSQTQKAIVLFDSTYIKYPELGKFVETEIQLMVARTWQGGKNGDFFMGMGFSLMKTF